MPGALIQSLGRFNGLLVEVQVPFEEICGVTALDGKDRE